MSRLVLLVTSPRVAAGLLSADAWDALRSGPVLTADPTSPQLEPLRAAGVAVTALDGPPEQLAAELLAGAATTGTATLLVGDEGHDTVARAVTDLATRLPSGAEPVELEVRHGSWDVPGARLLDAVATVDRLRSPGGCPWDATQDHGSLAPYLLEEAYEAFQAIEDGDAAALREELGDVLFHVVLHARVAEELPESDRWSVDDVAVGLVDKLRRRHPHVFGGEAAPDPADLQSGWDTIKAAERGDASALSSVPLGAPALTLAATLLRKAARLGVPVELLSPELAAAEPAARLAAAAAEFERSPSMDSAGTLLWATVAAAHSLDLDAEAALRAHARAVRDRVTAVEAAIRAAGDDPARADALIWQQYWPMH